MRVIPIMFSAPMVLALLDGRKSMTRRKAWSETRSVRTRTAWQKTKVGDRLWVREALADHRGEGDTLCFAANNVPVDKTRAPENFSIKPTSTMPGMFMPRWASRLTLVVTAMKIEKLQDINEADVLAEGVSSDGGPGQVGAFMTLWENLHGVGSWAKNPDVICLTFRVVNRNIDEISSEAA